MFMFSKYRKKGDGGHIQKIWFVSEDKGSPLSPVTRQSNMNRHFSAA